MVNSCGCKKSSKNNTGRGEIKESKVVIDEHYNDIPEMDYEQIDNDVECGCGHHRRKDPSSPIVVEPGNDVPLSIKLVTADDATVIDVDANELQNLRVLIEGTCVDHYIDLYRPNVVHIVVPTEVLSDEGPYDILVKGVWRNNYVSFTFHDKILVTSRHQHSPISTLEKQISYPEQYIGNAVFIPAFASYQSEEDLKSAISKYNRLIKKLDTELKEVEEQKERILTVLEHELPQIRKNTETIIRKVNETNDNVTSSKEEILRAIEGLGAATKEDLMEIIEKLD